MIFVGLYKVLALFHLDKPCFMVRIVYPGSLPNVSNNGREAASKARYDYTFNGLCEQFFLTCSKLPYSASFCNLILSLFFSDELCFNNMNTIIICRCLHLYEFDIC